MGRSLCSESDKIWALRYIREAKVDLSLAKQTRTPEAVKEISILAMKKAQLSVQHALGQPEYLDLAAAEAMLTKTCPSESPIRILVKMKEATQNLSELEPPIERETVVETAEIIVDAAESIVSVLTA